jgi:hypothetical protein
MVPFSLDQEYDLRIAIEKSRMTQSGNCNEMIKNLISTKIKNELLYHKKSFQLQKSSDSRGVSCLD